MKNSLIGSASFLNNGFQGVVFIKNSDEAQLRSILPHAAAIAAGLNRSVQLVEILDDSESAVAPVDPVVWDQRKQQLEEYLAEHLKPYREAGCPMEVRVLDNSYAKMLGEFEHTRVEPILCFTRHHQELPWEHERTFSDFMSSHCNSVLLVPEDARTKFPARYKRVLITLDGSSRAERALPSAIAIARYYSAELILAHATPACGLTETGPLESEALEIQLSLEKRNGKVARNYLAAVRLRCSSQVDKISTMLLEKGDARHELVNAIERRDVDLTLIASHGTTGHSDMPTGSVARFLLEHVTSPLLMIGRELEVGDCHKLDTKIKNSTTPYPRATV